MTRALAVLAFLLPEVAFALSCLPSNAAITLDRMLAQGQDARIAIGVMHAMGSAPTQLRQDHTAIYAFDGVILTGSGWRTIEGMQISARVSCVSSWCGSLPPERLALYVLEETASGHDLPLHPCWEQAYPEPAPELVAALVRCQANGACEVADFEVFEAR